MESQSLLLLQKQLARNVKVKRRLLSISQEQLALEASVDRTYVSQIERGIGNPSLLILSKIADALEVSVLDLLAESSPEVE
jgi:transcriptional regulator with XRE-family HTH domain